MRAADRLEFAAMHSKPDTWDERYSALRFLMDTSCGKARCGYVDGQIVAVYGVTKATALSNRGNPWLAASEFAEAKPGRQAMARFSRSELRNVLPDHVAFLWNLVHDRNVHAVRWLGKLGFAFPGREINHGGLKWLAFEMEI
ncbi:MAG: hypothetical protein ACRCXM_16090 [Beijerinckiaceae bacterium]